MPTVEIADNIVTKTKNTTNIMIPVVIFQSALPFQTINMRNRDDHMQYVVIKVLFMASFLLKRLVAPFILSANKYMSDPKKLIVKTILTMI